MPARRLWPRRQQRYSVNRRQAWAGPQACRVPGRELMKSLSIAALLLMGSALTPVSAADLTQERALNVGKEPQNWLLHHGNYEGHRFSQLKTINTGNVKDLKIAFSVALGGIEGAGTRYKHGNLEATPIVEDGVMYVPDGWGTVYAIDLTSGKKG